MRLNIIIVVLLILVLSLVLAHILNLPLYTALLSLPLCIGMLLSNDLLSSSCDIYRWVFLIFILLSTLLSIYSVIVSKIEVIFTNILGVVLLYALARLRRIVQHILVVLYLSILVASYVLSKYFMTSMLLYSHIITLFTLSLISGFNFKASGVENTRFYLSMCIYMATLLLIYIFTKSFILLLLSTLLIPFLIDSCMRSRKILRYLSLIEIILISLIALTVNPLLSLSELPFLISILPNTYLGIKIRYREGYRPPHAWLQAWLGGKYFIEKIVATGGFSYVLKGRDESGRIYAIKVLRERSRFGKSLALDLNVIDNFRKEMSKYLLVNSSRIVKVYEVHTPPTDGKSYISIRDYLDDPPYVVMEYVDGISLRNYLRLKRRFDLRSFCRISIELLRAVKDLHVLGIAHLDIKPENILITRDGKVKLCDLGASRILTLEPDTVTQFSIGYAAPEVLKGKARLESDIYSLGCVFYEMLTGINPQVYKLKGSIIPSITDTRGDVSQELDYIILRCLSDDPSQRPSIDEILRIMDRLCRGQT